MKTAMLGKELNTGIIGFLKETTAKLLKILAALREVLGVPSACSRHSFQAWRAAVEHRLPGTRRCYARITQTMAD